MQPIMWSSSRYQLATTLCRLKKKSRHWKRSHSREKKVAAWSRSSGTSDIANDSWEGGCRWSAWVRLVSDNCSGPAWPGKLAMRTTVSASSAASRFLGGRRHCSWILWRLLCRLLQAILQVCSRILRCCSLSCASCDDSGTWKIFFVSHRFWKLTKISILTRF